MILNLSRGSRTSIKPGAIHAHEAFWAESRKVNGDAAGTRELIDVLLLHRSMEARDIIDGITAALQVGAVTADVVAVESRVAASGRGQINCHPAAQPHDAERRVISLTQRRLTDPAAVIAGLPADTRPVPTVAGYDELLKIPARKMGTPSTKEQVS